MNSNAKRKATEQEQEQVAWEEYRKRSQEAEES